VFAASLMQLTCSRKSYKREHCLHHITPPYRGVISPVNKKRSNSKEIEKQRDDRNHRRTTNAVYVAIVGVKTTLHNNNAQHKSSQTARLKLVHSMNTFRQT